MKRQRIAPPPPPPAPADQARFDAVTRCRARVDAMKLEGVHPRELELAVEELQAAVAAAPDMPPPPPPPAPVEDTDVEETIDPGVAADSAAPVSEQEN